MTREYDLTQLRDPIATALERYVEKADGRLSFDIAAASALEKVSGKHQYARNSAKGTEVIFSDDSRATLWTIAFMPEDGTGDSSFMTLDQTWTPGLPRHEKILPRSKKAMLAEIAMTLCAVDLDDHRRGPKLFATSLGLLGLVEKPREIKAEFAIGGIGGLGAGPMDVFSSFDLEPHTDVTVGPLTAQGYLDQVVGKRRGDPHAVYNNSGSLAVAAFLGIPTDASSDAFAALRSLHPQTYIN